MIIDKMNENINPETPLNVANVNHRLKKNPDYSLQLGTINILVIKNFENKPELPANYVEETWTKLQKTVIAIQNCATLEHPKEELYRAVENLCKHKMAHDIYTKLKQLIASHVAHFVDEVPRFNSKNPEIFLMRIYELWLSHREQITLIRNIFLYLDRAYALRNPTVSSILDLSLIYFRDFIQLNPVIETYTIESILMLIKRERAGTPVDRSLLKGVLRMLNDLNLYKELFEERFFKTTERQYRAEAKKYIEQADVPKYLSVASSRLEEEMARVLHYLNFSTEERLIQIVEQQFLIDHLKDILQKGLDDLLEQNLIDELHLLYDLFIRVPDGLNQLCKGFNSYIIKKGRTLVMDPEKDNIMIKSLLDFKYKMDRIVEWCFLGHEKFLNPLRNGFEYFINQRANKPAEMIAKYVDWKLRTGNTKSSEQELDDILNRIVILFRFIQGKDIFEAYYKKDMAKRLLSDKSASFDAEKSMLCKLKEECGGVYTYKLEGMFKDMELSRDMNNAFRQYYRKHRDMIDIDLNVHVLTAGFWPTYSVQDVKLPPEMVRCQNLYKEFYLFQHHGRKLQWPLNLGQCVLKASFPQGNKELQVSFIQTVVLMLFNDADVLSFEEIRIASNIEVEELKRTLLSLACGKSRVLIKRPKSRNIEASDKFRFNVDFTHKYCRVKINEVQVKETFEEQKATEESVHKDRMFQLDAAIVRIMKSHKILNYNSLLHELMADLKFSVGNADVKKRIDSLIDREYIRRDEDNINIYIYIA